MDPTELKEIRTRLGWTWKRLATELGVHPRSVAKWERAERPISGPVALAIRGLANAYAPTDAAVDVAELLKGRPPGHFHAMPDGRLTWIPDAPEADCA